MAQTSGKPQAPGPGLGHGEGDAVADDAAGDPVMQRLRALYDQVADEPLPETLTTLLEKLDEAERDR